MTGEWTPYLDGWIKNYTSDFRRAVQIQRHRKSVKEPISGVPLKELWLCTWTVPRLGAFQETIAGDIEGVKIKCEERLDLLLKRRFEKESLESE